MMKTSATSASARSTPAKTVMKTGTGFDTPKVMPRLPGSQNETISISDDGYKKAQSEEEQAEVVAGESGRFDVVMKKLRDQFISGKRTNTDIDPYEKNLSQGVMALGGFKQLNDWEGKGLVLVEKSILAANKALNQGLERRSKQMSGTYNQSALLINRHEIIKRSQNIPNWFQAEYEAFINKMGQSAAKGAFEQGALFYTGQ